MIFCRQNANGKAGERIVEAFVEEKLKFVYRKVNLPDIGIDGEIEILSKKRESSGGFLKVQVKTTEQAITTKRIKISLDEKHLDYFNSLTVQPILAVVSLSDKKIWWKPILHKKMYRRPQGGFGIPVDIHDDEMTVSSGRLLRMIGDRSNAMIAQYLIEEVEEQLTDIDEFEATGNYDLITADIWAERLCEIARTMRDARCLLQFERRYSNEISAIEQRYAAVNERISDRKLWFKDHGAEYILTARQREAIDNDN